MSSSVVQNYGITEFDQSSRSQGVDTAKSARGYATRAHTSVRGIGHKHLPHILHIGRMVVPRSESDDHTESPVP